MHIVLLRLSALGDILRVLPAWVNLAEAFPKASFQAVVEDRHAVIMEPFRRFEPVFVRREHLSHPLRAFPTLRRAAAEIAGASASLDFHGFLKSALLPWLAGIPERWGDGRAREGAHLLQTRPVRQLFANRYEQALGLAEAFGLSRGVPGLGRFRPVLRDIALPRPPNVWPRSDAPRIILVPGSSLRGRVKRWPAESWISLARSLARGADVRFVLGPSEDDLRSHLPRASGVPDLPLLPLWELAAILREADHVVTGDTGLLHLAVVSGVKVTALFGPSDPVVYSLPEGAGRILRSDVPCSPCRNRGCGDRICLDSLGVAAVRDAVEAALATVEVPRGTRGDEEGRAQSPC